MQLPPLESSRQLRFASIMAGIYNLKASFDRSSFSDRTLGASNFTVSAQKDKLSINVDDREKVVVKTMHLSGKSDAYQPGHKYGVVIMYLYDDKLEWTTANGTNCKSGYIVIQDADSGNVKKWTGEEVGALHGAIYRNVFGESMMKAHVVGEGFSFRSQLDKGSRVFNKPPGSDFHDNRNTMNEASFHCVKKIVDYWKEGGSSWAHRQRNFELKELLKDYEM